MTQPTQSAEVLSNRDTRADALRKVVAPVLARLRLAEATARADSDPEGAHQIRVATRRLRSGLRVFGGGVDALDAKRLGRALRWLGRGMGPLRDIDVQLERLPGLLEKALPKPAFEALRRAQQERRHDALRQAQSMLDSARYRGLLSSLTAIAAGKHPAAGRSAFKQARKALGKQYDRLRAAIDKGVDDSEALHPVRLKIKQLRYLLELVAPNAGKSGTRLLEDFTEAQKRLGEFHDAAVSLEWAQQWKRLGTLPAARLAKIEKTLEADAKLQTRRAARAARRLCAPMVAKRLEAVRSKLH